MARHGWRAGLALCLLATLTAAQDTAKPDETAEPEFVPAKFSTLFFEEDWSWVDDEEKTTDHIYPEMKWVDWGGGWYATFSAQIRYRYQNEKNKSLMGTSPERNDFNLFRTRVGTRVQHESGWAFYVEAIDARMQGNDRPATPIDRNDADITNAFVEYATAVGQGRVTARGRRM